VHIKSISICSTYEKPSKNKSCIGCIALHGMAYYIFLKSLRSLEEFRKNPHVKIPSKSSCANFPSLGKFKKKFQFLIRNFFLDFGPASSLISFQPSRTPPPPSRSGPVGQNLSIFHRYRTCPFSLLVRFRYLSVFSTSKLVRFGRPENLSDSA
jgi:hypothetical protein